jgi:hypothetical protein
MMCLAMGLDTLLFLLFLLYQEGAEAFHTLANLVGTDGTLTV